MIRWLALGLPFLLVFVGLEIYTHSELMRHGYTLQELQEETERLEEENRLLRRSVAAAGSWERLHQYARDEFQLGPPREVRFLQRKH